MLQYVIDSGFETIALDNASPGGLVLAAAAECLGALAAACIIAGASWCSTKLRKHRKPQVTESEQE
ncbi:hypothetical protein N4G70_00355 [Streptomyces sp. ASQP_92]|uniref:hypothetical protein n=1 Tax=Streptomyces sp. ASQP_92 TaxID=2979116 RepID=UPI0021BF58E5|nr:hypothetical protein [Streptomyces sp. ASQP_92]MCT9087316.1 hypothetical protein [Streptomyces sp. ASQP_92]